MTGELAHGVLLIVAYDGTEFCGWQRQPGVRTVQETLAAAVGSVARRCSEMRGASRTDARVHALGQVVSFRCDRELPPEAWMHELNIHLPDDVSVLHAEPCDPEYDPRHDARGKLYRYLLRIGKSRDPLTRHRAWQIGHPMAKPRTPKGLVAPAVDDYLDLEAMGRAARRLEGRHDFRAFQSSDDYRENTIRTLRAVRVVPSFGGREDLLAFEVEGNAFLKNMVRILAGTLLYVGNHKLAVDDIPALLHETSGRQQAGPTAPPHGLTLVEVHLGRED